jgi:hypothetical protein
VAPGDSRFQPFLAFAFESFAAKHGRKPLWQGKDLNGLKNLLKNHSAESVSLERLQANWQNFLDSTEPFTVKQGDSLCYFCSNVDKFSDGPILAALGRGGTNGKPTATDLAIRNARRSDSTSQLIKQWLFRFGIEHKEDVAPRLPLWLETFGGMDPAILESLFQRALKTCRFFPKISEILEHVDHTKETALAGMAKGAGPASHGLES